MWIKIAIFSKFPSPNICLSSKFSAKISPLDQGRGEPDKPPERQAGGELCDRQVWSENMELHHRTNT